MLKATNTPNLIVNFANRISNTVGIVRAGIDNNSPSFSNSSSSPSASTPTSFLQSWANILNNIISIDSVSETVATASPILESLARNIANTAVKSGLDFSANTKIAEQNLIEGFVTNLFARTCFKPAPFYFSANGKSISIDLPAGITEKNKKDMIGEIFVKDGKLVKPVRQNGSMYDFYSYEITGANLYSRDLARSITRLEQLLQIRDDMHQKFGASIALVNKVPTGEVKSVQAIMSNLTTSKFAHIETTSEASIQIVSFTQESEKLAKEISDLHREIAASVSLTPEVLFKETPPSGLGEGKVPLSTLEAGIQGIINIFNTQLLAISVLVPKLSGVSIRKFTWLSDQERALMNAEAVLKCADALKTFEAFDIELPADIKALFENRLRSLLS